MNIFRKIFGWFISLFVYKNKPKHRKQTRRAIKKHNESIDRGEVKKENKVIIFHRPEASACIAFGIKVVCSDCRDCKEASHPSKRQCSKCVCLTCTKNLISRTTELC